jgi:hypothetical protein
MDTQPLVELIPAQLIRIAAECHDLRRQSDEILARSRTAIALADHAAHVGHHATARMRHHQEAHRLPLHAM